MSFVDRVNSMVRKYSASLKAVADKQAAMADAKARRRMQEATTQAEKLRIKAKADQEKAAVYRELHEAQVAAAKAAAAVKKAKQEAGDIPLADKLWKSASNFRTGLAKLQKDIDRMQNPPRKKRRVVSKKTTAKRRTGTAIKHKRR